jgi:hypothetical protein
MNKFFEFPKIAIFPRHLFLCDHFLLWFPVHEKFGPRKSDDYYTNNAFRAGLAKLTFLLHVFLVLLICYYHYYFTFLKTCCLNIDSICVKFVIYLHRHHVCNCCCTYSVYYIIYRYVYCYNAITKFTCLAVMIHSLSPLEWKLEIILRPVLS